MTTTPETAADSEARAHTASLIRDYYKAFNAGQSEAMLAFLTDDVIHDVNQGERRHGLEKFRAFNARMDHHYKEDLKDIAVMVSKDGTRAAAEFNVHGTYRNTDGGVAPNTLCPPHLFQAVCSSRLWVAGQLDRCLVTSSKILVEGEPTQFSDLDAFSVFLPQKCTGIA